MTKKYTSFQEALDEMELRNYEEATYHTNNIILKEDGTVEIGGASYEYEPQFIDSVFKITKLPGGNRDILPVENVLTDLNTLLAGLGLEVKVRFLNHKAYSLFPHQKVGIKTPLNYKEFLELVQSKINCEDAIVSQGENFLRVINFYPDTKFEYESNDFTEEWEVGIDIIAGEIFKSPPITINLILRNNNRSIVMPFLDKPIKVNSAVNRDKIRSSFDKKIDQIQVDYNLIKERFDKIYAADLNDEMVRILFSSSKFLPVDIKVGIFIELFRVNENHKMTNIVNKEALKDAKLANLLEEVMQGVANNRDQFMSIDNVYKADTTLGSFFGENNKKFNEALLA